ncbi:mitochondrial Rho GTPase 1-like isoform X1 [Oryza brachyantha]|uniref:mitochondrial Rho GTPase 1-like isoform X1 n=1 Tax=Oryza brachyantha TaxID=4533 RepID=UPI0007763C70|nr:mitochondrial Rho GTPase 1-like isoform X1 [Oryza brachyantha]
MFVQQLKAPLILVGCKLDLRNEQQQVAEIFYYAQEAVIHPIDPIFDYETQFLRPRCVAALNRIFSLCDRDGDGALSDVEFNKFQVRTH